MSFIVKTDPFEGPLDVLLSLIEKRKLLVNEISLAAVTDDFIKYLEETEDSSMGTTAHFILVASTLVLIKSKSLLPTLELSEEEQHDIEDLETRLKLYKRYKELGEHVRVAFGLSPLYAPLPARNTEPIFSPDKQTSCEELHKAALVALARIPKPTKTPQAVVEMVMSLEEMMDNLSARITNSLRLSFVEFSRSKSEAMAPKVHVIVAFLAMLELVKQGGIAVRQEGHFADIVIETEGVGTPRYTT